MRIRIMMIVARIIGLRVVRVVDFYEESVRYEIRRREVRRAPRNDEVIQEERFHA